jgi:hypothetical protein
MVMGMANALRTSRLLVATALIASLLATAAVATDPATRASAADLCSTGAGYAGARHPVYTEFACFGPGLGWARIFENPGYTELRGPVNSDAHSIYPALQPFEVTGSRGAYLNTFRSGFRRVFHAGENRNVYFTSAPERHVNWYRFKNGTRSPAPAGYVLSCQYADSCISGHSNATGADGSRYTTWLSHRSEWRYRTWGIELCGSRCDIPPVTTPPNTTPPPPVTLPDNAPRLPLPEGPASIDVRSFAAGRAGSTQSITAVCQSTACGLPTAPAGSERAGYRVISHSVDVSSFTLTPPSGWREGREYDLCNASGNACGTVSSLPTGVSGTAPLRATVKFSRATSQGQFFTLALTGTVTITFESWWIENGTRRTATDTRTYTLRPNFKPANRLPAGDQDERFIVVAPVLS